MVAFDRMLERRVTGEPLQYVLGSWSFRHLDLYLDKRVLIPRPETEVVTEYALAEYDRSVAARGDRHGVVVDLGTGSGAIALSIASSGPAPRCGPPTCRPMRSPWRTPTAPVSVASAAT